MCSVATWLVAAILDSASPELEQKFERLWSEGMRVGDEGGIKGRTDDA